MQTISPAPSHAELIAAGATSCLDFVHQHFPSKFDWLRLAESAASKASSYITLHEEPLEAGLAWLRVAVELYEAMADYVAVKNEASARRLVMPAIGLRALALKTWGENAEDSVRNVKAISARFLSVIKISPQQLRDDISFPRTSEVRDALEVTRYLEPLRDSELLENRMPEIFEYCSAARIAKERAHARAVDTE